MQSSSARSNQGMSRNKLIICFLVSWCFNATLTFGEFIIRVSKPVVTGQKAVIRITMSNSLSQRVESARVASFLIDGQGKILGQSTQWVVGGSKNSAGLS